MGPLSTSLMRDQKRGKARKTPNFQACRDFLDFGTNLAQYLSVWKNLSSEKNRYLAAALLLRVHLLVEVAPLGVELRLALAELLGRLRDLLVGGVARLQRHVRRLFCLTGCSFVADRSYTVYRQVF